MNREFEPRPSGIDLEVDTGHEHIAKPVTDPSVDGLARYYERGGTPPEDEFTPEQIANGNFRGADGILYMDWNDPGSYDF
jgi:hypothetical protein